MIESVNEEIFLYLRIHSNLFNMKSLLCICVLVLVLNDSQAQRLTKRGSSTVLDLNQQIDQYVVDKNITALQNLYSEDFVFSHGTGLVEGKKSWLNAVRENNYLIRKHDSVTIEMHRDIAVAKGKLTVQRKGTDKVSNYWLRYIRVYAFKHRHWQMISHSTTYEHDE